MCHHLSNQHQDQLSFKVRTFATTTPTPATRRTTTTPEPVDDFEDFFDSENDLFVASSTVSSVVFKGSPTPGGWASSPAPNFDGSGVQVIFQTVAVFLQRLQKCAFSNITVDKPPWGDLSWTFPKHESQLVGICIHSFPNQVSFSSPSPYGFGPSGRPSFNNIGAHVDLGPKVLWILCKYFKFSTMHF